MLFTFAETLCQPKVNLKTSVYICCYSFERVLSSVTYFKTSALYIKVQHSAEPKGKPLKSQRKHDFYGPAGHGDVKCILSAEFAFYHIRCLRTKKKLKHVKGLKIWRNKKKWNWGFDLVWRNSPNGFFRFVFYVIEFVGQRSRVFKRPQGLNRTKSSRCTTRKREKSLQSQNIQGKHTKSRDTLMTERELTGGVNLHSNKSTFYLYFKQWQCAVLLVKYAWG